MSSGWDNYTAMMPSDDDNSLLSIKFEEIENRYKCFGINSETIDNNLELKDISKVDSSDISINIKEFSKDRSSQMNKRMSLVNLR